MFLIPVLQTFSVLFFCKYWKKFGDKKNSCGSNTIVQPETLPQPATGGVCCIFASDLPGSNRLGKYQAPLSSGFNTQGTNQMTNSSVISNASSSTSTPVVVFEYGKVVPFTDLPAHSVALDGYVQGPQQDPTQYKFSFDHHAGCSRLVTLATCQQVAISLRLGLCVNNIKLIFANDIDADTVMAVWLLLHPERLDQKHVRKLVDRIGMTDSHGPIFPPHPLHSQLGPRWGSKEPQTLEMLNGYLAVLDKWFETGEEPAPQPPRPGRGFALKATGNWEPVQTPDGFGPLYEQDYLAAALVTPANQASYTWVIGKRSDLVPLPIGPADGSKDRSGDYLPTLLGELARAEETKGVSSKDNWGGGTSIGGSPRLPGGVGSKLSEAEVLDILNKFTIG